MAFTASGCSSFHLVFQVFTFSELAATHRALTAFTLSGLDSLYFLVRALTFSALAAT